MEKQVVSEPENGMVELMQGMQAENERLISVLRFYADPDSWSAKNIREKVLVDRGAMARQILKEAVGYE